MMSISEKLTTIAENVKRVYGKGVEQGIEQGLEQGRQEEWSDFWDVFQSKGNRVEWDYQFKGSYWNGNTFKPKYNMKVVTAGNMFSSNNGSPAIDLRKEALGVEIDFSKCTFFNNIFGYQSVISAIGVLDTRASSNLYNLFVYGTSLHTVEKLILKDDGSQTNLIMNGCSSLKHITVEGKIGTNFNLQSSPLTKVSIESIISCLSTNTTGKTLTLKKSAVNSAFAWNFVKEAEEEIVNGFLR